MSLENTGRLIFYTNLINDFLLKKIDILDFERKFSGEFKNETVFFPQCIFDVLDTLFADIDAYNPNINLRGNDSIGEDELRERARRAHVSLMAYLLEQPR